MASPKNEREESMKAEAEAFIEEMQNVSFRMPRFMAIALQRVSDAEGQTISAFVKAKLWPVIREEAERVRDEHKRRK